MNGTANNDQSSSNNQRWLVFVSGATASGKSSIAKYLASRLRARFIEGDDVSIVLCAAVHHWSVTHSISQFHPKANIEKMHRGEPLDDSDRQGWLEALSEHASVCTEEPGPVHIVMTCSALKREYRDILREGCRHRGNFRVRILFLDAPESVLRERAGRRKGHFVDPSLVVSQFVALERPGIDEKDTMIISVIPPLETVQRIAFDIVSEMLQKDGN